MSASATELAITGMSCSNCSRHVAEALQHVPGVATADVSLAQGRANVRWNDGVSARVPSLVAAVKAAGYDAQVAADETGSCQDEEAHCHSDHGWRDSVILGLLCTVPLMIGDWIFGWGMLAWFQWCSLALALPVQVFTGARFYQGAWRQLKSGRSNLDTLVALGSTAAFGYSLWALFSGQPGHSYFMEAAAIITLVSLGHWMESLVSARAEKSLRSLFQLAPPTARRKNSDGSESEVPIAQLKIDDAVVLRPGDRVPADGSIRDGSGNFDEAMLTGESVPAEKGAGAQLYAGTVNLNGSILMTVTAIGETTAVSRIIAAVKRAQNSRADIQRLADRISSVFVPIIVAVAIAAGLWWGLAPNSAVAIHTSMERFLWPSHPPFDPLGAAMVCAVAVLIVACPCAMGLATPIAIMAGANAGARRGILIRDGVALEKAGNLTAIVFDKTGTLTVGKPAVAAVETWDDNSGFDARQLMSALGRGSKHPLSQAIATVSNESILLREWREIPGGGVAARLPNNSLARMGSLSWLANLDVDISPAQKFIDSWTARGAAIVALAIDSRLTAIAALRDTLKPGAAEVISKFRRQGLKVRMITGDSPAAARIVGMELGFKPDEIFAGVKPEEKAGLVQKFQSEGDRVAFVGDGINDAPALEQADLGIAVSRASDIAGDAADLILLQSDIHAIPEALDLARATLRTIRQNLFWAFFYNAAAVPLAALGFVSPILCAAAMGLSDLVVVGNALRLNRR